MSIKQYSFLKRERLQNPNEFQNVYKKGDKIVSRYFVLFFLREKGCAPRVRLGITVTRSVGKAFLRNRIKRIVRETFRLSKENLPEGLLVIKARLSAAEAKKEALRTDLEKAFERLQVGC